MKGKINCESKINKIPNRYNIVQLHLIKLNKIFN